MKFWNAALKYHAPATISSFVFFYLAKNWLEKEDVIKNNPWLTFCILLVIANFCAFVLYRSTSKKKDEKPGSIDISKNKVKNNEVEKSLTIGSIPANEKVVKVEIKNNEVSGNKVKGNLNIGARNQKDD